MSYDPLTRPSFIHERFGDLPDAELVAVCRSYRDAELMAKALATKASAGIAYVVTDSYEGKQFVWTKERVEACAHKDAVQ